MKVVLLVVVMAESLVAEWALWMVVTKVVRTVACLVVT